MTNREYMAKQLSDPDWIDDGGASYEAMVYYNIGCPYNCGDKRAHCKGVDGWYGLIKKPTRETCSECKMEWLEAEVDE
ncbi:MAG: hypothetical protein IKE94_15905 [Aeriscardovia sp.]|nr:hypothetical protein [Aeriscardovia sp.]